MKTTFFLTALALAARVALADIPPACLLHGVNTQDQPSDLKAVCGDGANQVQAYLAQNCGNNADTAQKAFVATCSSAGQSVAAYTASGTSQPTGAKQTTSGGSGSASRTGSGSSTSSTGGANIDHKAPMGPMAAAAIALVGAVAAL